MARIAKTCSANTWTSEVFKAMVDANELAEVRAQTAYDRPIDRVQIRSHVLAAMLGYAMPAGNA